ncbi:MAG: hypothetical protein D6731_16445 [Planctomycetota bacterium]|nr:MAG: hypothetical protein D6731_16445 [Planctomycetota bacterium]
MTSHCRWILPAALLSMCSLSDETSAQDVAAPVEQELQRLRERVAELEGLRDRVAELEADREREASGEDDPLSDRVAEAVRELAGRVHLSGYFVGGVFAEQRHKTSLRPLLRDRTFRAGDLSLYLRAELPWDFSVSGQIIFFPRPQDNLDSEDEDFEVERLFLQWAPVPQFRIKLGKFITPVGYWVYLIHTEPQLPTLSVPHIVRQRIFDEEGVGAVLEGEQAFGRSRVGYAAWISNGHTKDPRFDDNRNSGYGGRLYWVLEDLGDLSFLQVGASAYTDRVRRALRYTPADPRLERVAVRERRSASYFADAFEARGLTAWGEPIGGYWNRAVAADLVVEVWGLRLRAEVMVDWVRPRRRSVSRFRRWGYYVYLGYSFTLPSLGEDGPNAVPLGELEPFVRIDRYDGNTDFVHELGSLHALSVGMTYRINSYVQFRIEGIGYRHREGARDYLGLQSGVVAAF